MANPSQIKGFTPANIAEVEASTHALRGTLRPSDYGSLGVYRVAGLSGIIAAPTGSNAVLFSFRWSSVNYCLIRSILCSAAGDTVGFTVAATTPGYIKCRMAHSFTGSDTGGTSLIPSGNMNKLRTSGMGTSLVTDVRIATTATLTAGTRDLDLDPICQLPFAISASAGKLMLPPKLMFKASPGEFPMLLVKDEGFIITTGANQMPTTGTWRFACAVVWEERATFP